MIERNPRHLNILGTRGYPAAHGGFETFVAHLAPFLVAHGWSVNVYCQSDEGRKGQSEIREDQINGVNRHIVVYDKNSPWMTVKFDVHSVLDVLRRPGIDLVLGYNTAFLCAVQRGFGRTVVMNMDGVEWKRAKWSWPIKAWFYLNEFLGAHLANVAIADHPEMARHLRRHGKLNPVVIPYGSDIVDRAATEPLRKIGVEAGAYDITVARIEPENSILEIVAAFSSQTRSTKLVVVGNLTPDREYHRRIRSVASEQVLFPGGIYETEVIQSLRYHCRSYIHGHTVGGTNPSLVEALGAGNAIVAHDNVFNRWVAGPEQMYFRGDQDLSSLLEMLESKGAALQNAREASRARHRQMFLWDQVLNSYLAVLEQAASRGEC